MKFKALEPGSIFGLIAPGSSASSEMIAKGIQTLESFGFKTKCPLNPNCGEKKTLSYAPARVRAEAFMNLIEDPEVKAILSIRGGYGSMQLLPFLDFKKIQAAKKFIAGYSDITALLIAIHKKARLPVIHGPNLAVEFAQSSADAEQSVQSFLSLLTDPSFTPKYSCGILRNGFAEGRIIAGNLTVLCSLLGTPWDVDYDDAVLMLEDVNEAPYRVHRSLMQLKLAGKLKKLAGVVFGRFSRCGFSRCGIVESSHGPEISEVIEEAVNDVFEDSVFPILSDFPFGHDGLNTAVALGCRARIDSGTLSMMESPVC